MSVKEWLFGKSETIVEGDSFILNEQPVLTKGGMINPSFKGEVEQNKIKFPIELGEEHPFDFKITEGMYKKHGFTNAVVNKYVDFIVGGGFYVESEDERAQKIIEDFIRDVNFDIVLRSWIKEGLVKNGILEIGGKKDEAPKGLKVLDSNYMYMQRDNKGVIEGWNQYVGGFDKFDKSKVVSFKPYQIAHLALNKIGDDAYGLGIVYPALKDIDNLLQLKNDEHMLMERKANSPYDITMGKIVGDKYIKPSQASIDKMGKDLEWLNNKHEWVHDGLTEIKALDFGSVGDKFASPIEQDEQALFYDYQIPAVIMGMARVNEGIAKVQMDTFERRINSIQMEAEKVIEEQIFKRILNANGIDVHVEFVWGRPSNTEKYERLAKISELIKSPLISQSMRDIMEKDILQLMDYDEKEYDELRDEEEIEKKKREEEEKKRELQRPQPLVPGQNANRPKPVVKPKPVQPKAEHVCDDSCNHVEEGHSYKTINEWLGFNYKKYLGSIKDVIGKEKFVQLAAKSDIEEMAGLLSSGQIRALKGVLDEGFTKGLSIEDMSKNIERRVKPNDLLKMEAGKIITSDNKPVVVRFKDTRNMAIARSEITRVANEGAEKQFLKNGYTKERWVASYGSRTCPECEALDNQIFTIGVDRPPLPLHTNCRCTVEPVEGVA